jgi:hypothetical protein
MSAQGSRRSQRLGVGIAIGIAIGVAVGVVMDNIAVWTGIGVVVGVVLGAVMVSRLKAPPVRYRSVMRSYAGWRRSSSRKPRTPVCRRRSGRVSGR